MRFASFLGSFLIPVKVHSSHSISRGVLEFAPLGAVHKLCLQEEGGSWSKKSTFCKLLYHRKCKGKGVGGQKKTNLVDVACERPLS